MLNDDRTLDPEDWTAIRSLGHRMVDDAVDYLRTVRERPVWQPVPEASIRSLQEPLPLHGSDAETAYAHFARHVMPYALGNVHPRFWGWVTGTGTLFGALAEMASATLNMNASGCESAAIHVEEQIRRWFAELMDFPADASGFVASGSAEGNFTGIACALHSRAGIDTRELGLIAAPQRPVAYSSVAAHFSVGRALRLLGLGECSHRRIEVDGNHQINLRLLDQAIAEDLAAGLRPALIVGNAGTVGCGAFDDLEALAACARKRGLWFHVDGAFGALVALCPEYRPLVRGLAFADSLTFDFHKWLHVPIEAGYVLIRDAAAHLAAFSTSGSYVSDLGRGVAVRPNRFTDLGMQQSRSARAIKAWLTLKHYGLDRLGEMIRKNISQAAYLRDRISNTPGLELLAPVPLNIVCFRYVAEGLDPGRANELNRRILVELHERGIAVPSSIMAGDRFGLRCAITNHRTRRQDLDVLLESVLSIASNLTGRKT